MEPEYGMSRSRTSSSVVEEIDLSDKTHCILCFNDLNYVVMGVCGHKHVCNQCGLRLRLLINDFACPICKVSGRIFLNLDIV